MTLQLIVVSQQVWLQFVTLNPKAFSSALYLHLEENFSDFQRTALKYVSMAGMVKSFAL